MCETGNKEGNLRKKLLLGASVVTLGYTMQIAAVAIATGIGITVAPIILLKDSTVGFATAPESDGEFVTFNVLDDPTGISGTRG